MSFVVDALSDTGGVNLTAHVGATGATWLKNGASTGDFIFGTTPGGVRLGTINAITAYYASGSPASADYDVQADANIQGGMSAYLILRMDITAQTWYLVGFNSSTYTIYRFNAGTITQLATLAGGVSSGTHTVKGTIRGSGATVTITMYVDGSQVLTFADTSGSRLTAAGKAGLYSFFGTAPTDANTIHWSNFSASDPVLSPGTVSLSSATGSTVNLVSTSPTAGTLPYTHQWYRSTSSGFTPGAGNLLAGQTSLTLSDSSGLAAGTVYFYKLVTTDAVLNTVTTAQFSASLWQTPVVLGWIGDSITFGFGVGAGLDPPTQAQLMLSGFAGPRSVGSTNRGVSGSTSAQWILGSGTNNLENSLTAFAGAGVTHVHVCLGANDAQTVNLVTAATYQSNIASICATLIANGYKVILSAPIYFDISVPGAIRGDASLALIPLYQGQLALLANGTTILLGDMTAGWTYFANHTAQLQVDGTHPNTAGAAALGTIWAYGVAKALGFVSGGGGGGGGGARSGGTGWGFENLD